MPHTVLLVDDDERLLSGMLRALHKQPFQILTARNGDEAILFLKTHDIDVIVTDQRMPGMSGNDLLVWVLENCPDVMRIVLTGFADTDVAIRAINEAGVCYFFTKPCNEARLAVAIHKAIERKDAIARSRKALAASQRQLHDLETQTQTISQDLDHPLEQVKDSCRQLDEEYQDRFDSHGQTLLGDARTAADEASRVASQLHQLAE